MGTDGNSYKVETVEYRRCWFKRSLAGLICAVVLVSVVLMTWALTRAAFKARVVKFYVVQIFWGH